MTYVGPLYIFSRHDKYLYLLTTIDGVVIEQLFHMSRLNKGLLRLPNSKMVKHITDHKLEMIKRENDEIIDKATKQYCRQWQLTNLC